MRVGRGVAGPEDDGVIGGEAGEGVDVGVGVVALEVAVVEPQHAVLGEPAGQPFAQFAARGLRVAFVQALPGGQQGAVAVGFDGAAFQSKINIRSEEHKSALTSPMRNQYAVVCLKKK